MKQFVAAIGFICLLTTACQTENKQADHAVIEPTKDVQIIGNWQCDAVDGNITLNDAPFGMDLLTNNINAEINSALKDIKLSYLADNNFKINYDKHELKGKYVVDNGLLNHFDKHKKNVFIQDVKLQQQNDAIAFYISGSELLQYIKIHAKGVPEAIWKYISVSDYKLTFKPIQ